VTRLLISLAPAVAICVLIAVQAVSTARRRRREDRMTAERIGAAVAARRDGQAYIAWLEEQFAAERNRT
jgi:hypothetical protein